MIPFFKIGGSPEVQAIIPIPAVGPAGSGSGAGEIIKPIGRQHHVGVATAELGVGLVNRTRWTLYVRDPEGNRIGLSHYPDEA